MKELTGRPLVPKNWVWLIGSDHVRAATENLSHSHFTLKFSLKTQKNENKNVGREERPDKKLGVPNRSAVGCSVCQGISRFTRKDSGDLIF